MVKDMNEYVRRRYHNLKCKDEWNGRSFDEEYYIILNVCDRLGHLLRERYKTYAAAERALGYCDGELYNRFDFMCTPPNLRGLKRLCKLLDISLQWTIFGGDDKGHYGNKQYTYGNLKRLYKSAYVGRKNPLIAALISHVTNNRLKCIPLKYLIRIAREQRVTIDWLVEG